jgi:hypothetical protein
MKKTKSHARAPGKRNFSIALPEVLIASIQSIADAESRSKNKQIEYFLTAAVREYFFEHSKKSSTSAISPLASVDSPPVAKPSRSSHA